MKSRTDCINKLNVFEAQVKDRKFNEAQADSDSLLEYILDYHFYSILGKYFIQKAKIDEYSHAHDKLFLDYFVALSSRISLTNKLEIQNKLTDLIKSNAICNITIPPRLMDVVPIKVKLFYHQSDIYSGSNALLHVHILSDLPADIECTSLDIYFSHDKAPELKHAINKFTIQAGKQTIFKETIQIPKKVSSQEVLKVSFNFNESVVVYNLTNPAKLTVLPDPNVCKIEVNKPARTLIDVKIPVAIRLTATYTNLVDVQPTFHTNDQFPPYIEGDFLPFNVNSGETVEKIFYFESSTPVFTKVCLTITLQTEQAGMTTIKHDIGFDFISPFRIQPYLFDSNYKEHKNPNLSSDAEYYLETTLQNVLEEEITLNNIEGYQTDDFPLKLLSGEQYTYTIRQKPGNSNRKIHFTSKDEDIVFVLKMPPFAEVIRKTHYTFTSPNSVNPNQKFKCILNIDRNEDTENQCMPVRVSVAKRPQFAQIGPTETTYYAWSSKVTKISFTFIALVPGSYVLPKITITDATGVPVEFIRSIIVNYQ